jgi:hypothetical protein
MSYEIFTDKLSIEEICAQIRVIKEFPATVQLYDRVFILDTAGEKVILLSGIEIGFFLFQEAQEQKDKKHLIKSLVEGTL